MNIAFLTIAIIALFLYLIRTQILELIKLIIRRVITKMDGTIWSPEGKPISTKMAEMEAKMTLYKEERAGLRKELRNTQGRRSVADAWVKAKSLENEKLYLELSIAKKENQVLRKQLKEVAKRIPSVPRETIFGSE